MAAPGHLRPTHDTRVVTYLTDAEVEQIDQLVEARDLSRSTIIRDLLRTVLNGAETPGVAA